MEGCLKRFSSPQRGRIHEHLTKSSNRPKNCKAKTDVIPQRGGYQILGVQQSQQAHQTNGNSDECVVNEKHLPGKECEARHLFTPLKVSREVDMAQRQDYQ
jgi:hypothetical protein